MLTLEVQISTTRFSVGTNCRHRMIGNSGIVLARKILRFWHRLGPSVESSANSSRLSMLEAVFEAFSKHSFRNPNQFGKTLLVEMSWDWPACLRCWQVVCAKAHNVAKNAQMVLKLWTCAQTRRVSVPHQKVETPDAYHGMLGIQVEWVGLSPTQNQTTRQMGEDSS